MKNLLSLSLGMILITAGLFFASCNKIYEDEESTYANITIDGQKRKTYKYESYYADCNDGYSVTTCCMYLKPDADEQITILFPGFVTGKYPDYLGITISYNPEEGPSWGKIQNEENYIEISSYGDDFIEDKFYFTVSDYDNPPTDHIIEGNFKAINFGRD